MPEFEGASDSSNLQEALERAVEKALNAVSHTDPMVSYVVKRISGTKSGFSQLNQITVVIDVPRTPTRETKDFVVTSCEACGRAHRLTIEFTRLFVTMQWPNPQPTSKNVGYRCPVNNKDAMFLATFPGPVENVEVARVEST
jgi:hypothetical protein